LSFFLPEFFGDEILGDNNDDDDNDVPNIDLRLIVDDEEVVGASFSSSCSSN
jgi:hypothetical protein